MARVGTCASTFTLCRNYDPSLHKISAYWQAGFNPNSYLGNSADGLSYYLPGYSRLFILGGLNGDVSSSDTDHFDNAVIIHEYGHFLEDNWFRTDSPGGSHHGNDVLDPRLAWSEGWGDFFQAAVRGESHYIDTIGNVDGTTAMAFYSDLETPTIGSDYPTASGEGNFREFATTRTLWDAVDAVNLAEPAPFGGSDDITGGFGEIWAALTKTLYGFRDGNFAFRNPSLVYLAQQYLRLHPTGSDSPAQDWSNILSLNRSAADSSRYAQYLISSRSGGSGFLGSGSGSVANTACTSSATVDTGNASLSTNSYFFSLLPVSIAGDSGSLSTSNLFKNNRFFQLHLDAGQAGTHTLQLIYQDDDGSSTTADLDLYLYNSKARFAVSSDILGYSRNSPSGTPTNRSLQSESVSASLVAGNYLVNVNVYTGGGAGSRADYNLVLDGVVLCPGNLVPP